MRTFVLFVIPFALMMAADQPAATSGAKTTRKDSKKTTAVRPSEPPSIPAGAEAIGPNVYRYKDAKGKTWLYRKGPMGISRMEDTTAAAPSGSAQPPAPSTAAIRVTDLGDSVRFEQPTPMGLKSWVTKKSDLSPKEKAVMEQANGARDSAKPEK